MAETLSVEDLAHSIMSGVKNDLKDVWNEIKAEDRELIEIIARDAAGLKLDALAGRDISREWVHIKSQFSSLQASYQAKVTETFLSVLKKVAMRLTESLAAGLPGLL